MKIFQPKIISCLKSYSPKIFVNDLVAGIIVAIIALPLSIALAIASGVSPEKGLYTAIVAGLAIALLGGSKVNISGPTAAFATIVAGIVAVYDISGLVLATIMAGIILIVMGVCRFGSLIKYIPYTITTGFTSGIAVTIVIGQIKDFLGLTFPEGMPTVETMEKLEAVGKSITSFNPVAFLVGAVSLIILFVWPKISKRIPGSLIVVVLGVVVVKLFNLEVNTIGDLYTITRTPPTFALPQINFTMIKDLLPSAFTIAVLAGIESLLSCVVSDGMIGDKHNSNTELIAQGVGNICSGFFGGIPATGAIARTAANVKNGGKTPVSGIVHAVVLLLILVVLMPYAAWIPMPVIAAILIMVAYNMCEWRQFVRICKTAPKSDILVLVVTFVLTVVFDLVIAIEVGVIAAALLFMKRVADVSRIRKWENADSHNERLKEIPAHTEIIEIDGPMFFATVEKFDELSFKNDTKSVILRMRNVQSMDISAVLVLNKIYSKCDTAGVTLILSHVNSQPLSVLKKSGLLKMIGEKNIFSNIDEAILGASRISAEISDK